MAKKFKCNICGQTFEADSMPDKCPICMADSSNIEEVVEASAENKPAKKKGLDTNSNVYTIVYAAVMVIIVAFLLAFVSSSLKDIQEANVLRDTKNQILLSLNIEGLEGQAIDDKYAEVITSEKELNGNKYYMANVDGAVKYVFPVKGRGLWGGLWGYLSVDEDMLHTFGAYFGHESETAGLGARINERWFQQQFTGAPIFDAEGNIALTVVKAGAKSADYEIDGVTGATLTSNGVAAMVNGGLNVFGDIIKVAPCASAPEAEVEEVAAECADSLQAEVENN